MPISKKQHSYLGRGASRQNPGQDKTGGQGEEGKITRGKKATNMKTVKSRRPPLRGKQSCGSAFISYGDPAIFLNANPDPALKKLQ